MLCSQWFTLPESASLAHILFIFNPLWTIETDTRLRNGSVRFIRPWSQPVVSDGEDGHETNMAVLEDSRCISKLKMKTGICRVLREHSHGIERQRLKIHAPHAVRLAEDVMGHSDDVAMRPVASATHSSLGTSHSNKPALWSRRASTRAVAAPRRCDLASILGLTF